MKMETQNRGLKSYLFGDKAFYKAVFAIVVPIIIQNLITSFVSLLDNVMVGQLGTAQMSGVAIANQLIFIFNICIFGGISGASIYGAQFYGSGDYEGMRNGRYFTDLTEEALASILKDGTGLRIDECWVTSDVRPGRENEKWLNAILVKERSIG